MALCPDMVPFIDRRVDSRDLLQRSISRYEARKPARIAVGFDVNQNDRRGECLNFKVSWKTTEDKQCLRRAASIFT